MRHGGGRAGSGTGAAVVRAAGISHALALRSDGTLWGFGFNTEGQLGSGLPVHAPPALPALRRAS
ncbi:hypothetical protein [Corallococcus exercitus]|uniref:hypothetical protein n=1 Tax=Corallococcus exercitus TaxID=2316736 RepID=UPI0035D44C9A